MNRTFEDFVKGANEFYLSRVDSQRKGQAYYNYLATVRLDLASRVNGTDLDPFNDDSVIEEFLTFVMVAW